MYTGNLQHSSYEPLCNQYSTTSWKTSQIISPMNKVTYLTLPKIDDTTFIPFKFVVRLLDCEMKEEYIIF